MACLFGPSKSSINNHVKGMSAFSPPNPPTYEIKPIINEQQEEKDNHNMKCDFIINNKHIGMFPKCPWIQENCYQILKTKSHIKIVILHLKNISNTSPNKQTIIYSHGSSVDLGSCYFNLIDLATLSKCDIIAYDYTGYGQSESIPKEQEIYTDIENVFHFAVTHLNISIEKMIVFGLTIGAVPSVYIASQGTNKRIQGMILVSPITSGNVLVNVYEDEFHQCEEFNCVDRAADVECPVLLIHGKQDEIIPYGYSQMIEKEFKNVKTWYSKKGNHWNILEHKRNKYYSYIKDFLKTVMK